MDKDESFNSSSYANQVHLAERELASFLGAIDVFLSILTNGKVTRDNVGPHTDLLTSFPYVGSPHKIRSAERVAA